MFAFVLETMLAFCFSLPALFDSASAHLFTSPLCAQCIESSPRSGNASVALEQHASLCDPNVIQKGRGFISIVVHVQHVPWHLALTRPEVKEAEDNAAL